MHKNTVLAILLIASPILFVLAAYPDSFSMSWNQGRGGFLFGLAFIVAEIVGIKFVVSKNRLIFGIPLVIATVIYFIVLDFGLHDYIMNAAPAFNVVGCSIGNPQGCIYSWGWLWDFVVITIFVITAAIIMFGKKWIRIVIAGPVFLGGSAIILSLDTFFPFDTLGPLQYFVPYLVQTNVWVINALELGLATARDNIMFLQGEHGPFVLQVFWPSAGVHSIIIYSLVMMAFLLKMNIKRNRKAIYFGLGILGTIIINMIRIFSLSIFALKVSTNPVEFEEYHSIAGEIMFLPWLFIFLLVVTAIETKRMKKEDPIKTAKKVEEWLDIVGLQGFGETPTYQLSGGMQQRVALARCLINDPELILMDEPLGALDALTREKMQSLVLKIWKETGKTIILITHSVEEALLLGERLYVMAPRPGRFHKEYKLPFASMALKGDLREIKNNKEFVSKREEILSMIWDMEEEIMGKEI